MSRSVEGNKAPLVDRKAIRWFRTEGDAAKETRVRESDIVAHMRNALGLTTKEAFAQVETCRKSLSAITVNFARYTPREVIEQTMDLPELTL